MVLHTVLHGVTNETSYGVTDETSVWCYIWGYDGDTGVTDGKCVLQGVTLLLHVDTVIIIAEKPYFLKF